MNHHLSNSIYDIPEDLRDYATLRPSTDILDQSIGLAHIVVLFCRDCREGWGWHWSSSESAFRKHMETCSKRKVGGHGETDPPKTLGIHHLGKYGGK